MIGNVKINGSSGDSNLSVAVVVERVVRGKVVGVMEELRSRLVRGK